MQDTTTATAQPTSNTVADRRIAGTPAGRKRLDELWKFKRPFYYQVSQPDVGKGARGPVQLCVDDTDFAQVVRQLTQRAAVWAEPVPYRARSSRPATERDYKTQLPGEPTNNPEDIKAAFRQGHFKYQFAAGDAVHRSRVMICTDEDELAFVVRQVSKGASVHIELPANPST